MSKLITFDFDHTTSADGDPVHEIFQLMHKHNMEGDDVRILTTRMDEWIPEVEEFVRAFALPIGGIWNTNWEWKADWVEVTKTKIHTHFDDDPIDLVKLATLPEDLRPEKLFKVSVDIITGKATIKEIDEAFIQNNKWRIPE